MLKVAVGQWEGTDGAQVARGAVARCQAQLGGAVPQVVLIFVAGDFDLAQVTGTVRAAWPGVQLVGCTSGGDFSSELGFSDDSVTLLALGGEDVVIAAGVVRNLGTLAQADLPAAVQAALLAARPVGALPESLCLAFPPGLMLGIDPVIETLQRLLAPECALFGGLSGLPWSSYSAATRQLFGDEVLQDGMPLLLFCGPISYGFALSNSWTPLGNRQAVTCAHGYTIDRIGERTALEFYRYYLGSHSRPAFEFPLAVFTPDGENFALRVPLSVNTETGSILFTSPIPEGSIVQLTEVVRTRMLEQSGAMVAPALAQLAELGREPVVALVISCATRRQILGSQASEEVRLLRRHLPATVSLFGFYAMGEIAPLVRGGPSVLQSSSVITLLLGGDPGPARSTERLAPGAPVPPLDPATTAAPKAAGPLGAEFRASASVYAQQLAAALTIEPALMVRRLVRAELSLDRTEESKDLSSSLLRTINSEVDAARRLIEEQNATLQRLYAQLELEKRKSDQLLLNILPSDVADELKRTGHVEPVYYPAASVLFTDFTDFTRVASRMSPAELIRELDYYFSAFDQVIERHGLEKLKTIGDAYMAAAGVPVPSLTHAVDSACAAWEIQILMERLVAEKKRRGEPHWNVRIGINTGPLMAGVIGQKKFAYDIWGNTVNIAARLESTSQPGRINVSATTYELIKHRFRCEPRGKITAKNAGEIEMYFIVGEVE